MASPGPPAPGTPQYSRVDVTPITDPADPRVADFLDLRDHHRRAQEFAGQSARFICEGPLLVERLLRSGLGVCSVLVTHRARERAQPLLDLAPPATLVCTIDDAILEQLVGFEFHRGIMACGVRPPALSYADLLARCRLLVILEDLSNQDNVGSVFRNTAALAGEGAGVLLSPGCCDPLYRKSLRVSMGAALSLPFARVANWPARLADVREAGFTLLAMTPDPGATNLCTMHSPGRLALLLGAEGPGLTPGAMALAHARVRIPMSTLADSLNVATAGAIALSHLVSRGSGSPRNG